METKTNYYCSSTTTVGFRLIPIIFRICCMLSEASQKRTLGILMYILQARILPVAKPTASNAEEKIFYMVTSETCDTANRENVSESREG